MRTRFWLFRPALSFIGLAVFSGCNSSSSPSSSAAPTTSATKVASSDTSSTAASEDMANAPQRKPPAGTGNAIGRVLFNGKGAPGIEVKLCQDIGLVGGCSGATFAGKTDKEGFYIIDKVKPGTYSLAVRVFNSNSFIYPTAGIMSAAKFTIEKDQSLAVQSVNLWKTDLQVASPKNGGSVNTDKPQLSWKAYPAATKYKVTIHTKQGIGTLTDMETSETSVAPDKSLLNGEYQWKVEASNSEGTKIAETADDAIFKVTGQAGSNVVELVNPKQDASVPGTGLTLQWKPNPLAETYKVYLKGVKAKNSILSFESVTATSYPLTTPLPPDQYFWSVEAYKGDDKIASSSLQRFMVK